MKAWTNLWNSSFYANILFSSLICILMKFVGDISPEPPTWPGTGSQVGEGSPTTIQIFRLPNLENLDRKIRLLKTWESQSSFALFLGVIMISFEIYDFELGKQMNEYYLKMLRQSVGRWGVKVGEAEQYCILQKASERLVPRIDRWAHFAPVGHSRCQGRGGRSRG